MSWISAVIALGVSALLGMIATRLSIPLAFRLGLVSHPNRIVPQHNATVACFGGVSIAAAALAGWGLFQATGLLTFNQQLPPGLIVGGILFLLVGVGDDIFAFRPGLKLALQLSAAMIAVIVGLGVPLPHKVIPAFSLSCLWIVGIVNAANLTDVCDGLLPGLSLLAFLFFGFWGSGSTLIPLVLAGACAGFLAFNRPPARIFLGDAGSHLLGSLLAFFTLSEATAHLRLSACLAMILVAGVPLFEMLFLIVVRARKRIPFWKGSPDHFSLRLQAAGFSRAQTDLIAMTVMAVFCGIAWMLLRDPPLSQQAALVSAATLIVTFSWWFLLQHEVGLAGASGQTAAGEHIN